ncbi:MAG: hypothetical protein GXO39_04265 [Thermotogae bacterium]|nr:hypothetical protein [Thermotogota bacterium]
MAIVGAINEVVQVQANQQDFVVYTVPVGQFAVVRVVAESAGTEPAIADFGIKKADGTTAYFLTGVTLLSGVSPFTIDRLVLGDGESLIVSTAAISSPANIFVNGIAEKPDPQALYGVSQTPAPNSIPLSDTNGKLNTGWLYASVDPSQPVPLRENANGELQLKDRATGALYRLYVSNGQLGVEAV